jgi:hypothetical protein
MVPTRIVTFTLGVALFILIFLALHPLARNTLCTLSNSLPHSATDIPQIDSSRKLHLLLPVNAGAAGQSSSFCKTLLSAVAHGYSPIILNWDVDGDYYFMQRLKVTAVHEYLTNITGKDAENDLVFMMDALDAWLQVSPQTLIERFEELHTSGVVIGADKACWPNAWESFACQGVPMSTLPKGVYAPNEEPRWANSGTILGSVAAMRILYQDLINVFEEPGGQSGTDQGVFNEFLASRRLSLDYRSRLFWTTASSSPTTPIFMNVPYHIDTMIPHEMYPPLLYHTLTGEVPAVIHVNNNPKPQLEEWWGKLWWQQLQDGDGRFRDIVASRVEGAVIRFAGLSSKEWRDVCPKDVLGI